MKISKEQVPHTTRLAHLEFDPDELSLRKEWVTASFPQKDDICTPTAPNPVFKIGEKVSDPLEMHLSDIYTVTSNLAGIPAISVPSGLSTSGLPTGIQVQDPVFDEKILHRVAHALEEALQLKDRVSEP